MRQLVRAFLATSLDGFIAGPDDDLDWLPEPRPDEDYGFRTFLDETSVMVMGRRTYDVVAGFEGEWAYGDLPILVATHRPLDPGTRGKVGSASGTPADLLARARVIADGPVYVDGGALIRGFLADGLLDEVTVTIIPIVLGEGISLFAGVTGHIGLELRSCERFDDGLVQLRYAVAGNGGG